MPNLKLLLAAGLLTVSAAMLLTGCSSGDSASDLPKNYGQDWMSQMSTTMGGRFGGGGGQLVLDGDSKKANGSVSLEEGLSAGPYDVLAVCRSTQSVHVTIHDFTTKWDKNGESFSPRSLLGEGNIRCGNTTRIQINIRKGSDGITLDAATTDTSGRALWEAFIVAPGETR